MYVRIALFGQNADKYGFDTYDKGLQHPNDSHVIAFLHSLPSMDILVRKDSFSAITSIVIDVIGWFFSVLWPRCLQYY